MSKVLKIALPIAAIAVNVIPGVGQAISASLFMGTGLGAAASIAIGSGIVTGITTLGATIALQAGAKAVGLGPKVPTATLGQIDRLNASVNPNAYRTMVVGSTAMGSDIRYVEPSGTNQEYIDYIIGVACHRVSAIRQIWLEDREAWTAEGGVTPYYAGYLWIDTRTEGSDANTIAINGGGTWGNFCRLTGCAYIHLRIKRTGEGKTAESPFVGGLAARMTIIGDGMPLYDPRQDSTVPGGSGPMRADDQATWAFDAIGNNAALQILGYHLGWTINGVGSVGLGLPAARIDLGSFITAANLCDELVSLAAGGSEPRYRAAGVIRDSDDPSAALAALLAACNGRLRDDLGRISLAIMHNDLAAAAADPGLDDGDILGGVVWDPDPALDATPVVARGKYIDASVNALFQPVDYPEVLVTGGSADGMERPLPYDLVAVQSPSQAQRIASQVLQRAQYQRRLTATFSNRAWRYKVGDVVPITFSPLGFVEKLFRVDKLVFTYDGTCPMELVEENPAIYAWDAGEGAAVEPADPTHYDPRNAPYVLGLYDGTVSYADGTTIEDRKPAEAGATRGMLPTEADLLAGLNASVAAAMIAIADAQARIDEIEGTISVPIDELEARILAAEGEITSLTSDLATANSTISTVSTAVSNVEGDLADVTVRIGAAETTIETQQLAIETIDTQVATVTTDLATAGSNISLALTAIDVLEGTQATMASTIASQGSTITSLLSTTTTLAGTVATMTLTLRAGTANLLTNGDWSADLSGWEISPFVNRAFYPGSVGRFLDTNNPTGTTGFVFKATDYPGADYYTLSFEGVTSYGVGAYFLLQVMNADQTVAYASASVPVGGSWDDRLSATVPPVSDPAAKIIRAVLVEPPGTGASFTRVAIQRGQHATIWRDDATVRLTQSALSALGTQYASLSSTVSVHGVDITSNATAISTTAGNITTLFARASLRLGVGNRVIGWETNNNGSYGDFIIHTDYFGIADPDGGAGFSFSAGAGKVNDPTGVTRFQFGNLDV